nr:MAG TPA_asm: hypothetical protein [Caudoviricetes sp.]
MCKQFDFFTLFFGFLYKSKGVVSIMISSNYSFCYFRTFILWNCSYHHYNICFPIIDQHFLG